MKDLFIEIAIVLNFFAIIGIVVFVLLRADKAYRDSWERVFKTYKGEK